MGSEGFDMSHRLKASELLGKSECDFSETRILKGAGAATTVIVNTGVPRAPGSPFEESISVEKDGETQEVELENGEHTVIVVPADLDGIF